MNMTRSHCVVLPFMPSQVSTSLQTHCQQDCLYISLTKYNFVEFRLRSDPTANEVVPMQGCLTSCGRSLQKTGCYGHS